MSKVILVLGGARSGKSTFAEKLAKKIGGSNVTYIATAEALDQEMEERIAHHKSQRPMEWETIEAPTDIYQAIRGIENSRTVLIDCLTLYLSNRLLKEKPEGDFDLQRIVKVEEDIIEKIKIILTYAREREIDLIIVSNEVGQGLVPSYELGRVFRDISGRANQYISSKADEVYLTIAGLPLDLNELNKITEGNIVKDLGEI
ncbi:MAG: bifunctional adenosylcobinamide kinase/adenosylcobinamide-phosphate guanylyltransferase [Halanaerobiales bacterium]